MNEVKVFQVVASAIAGAFAFAFGEWTMMYAVLLMLVALDYGTGLINAWLQKAINSEVGFKGIARKVYIWVIVAIAHAIDAAIPQTNGLLATATCTFYIANEAISILENAAKIGLPVPKMIMKVLMQLKNKDEESEDKDE